MFNYTSAKDPIENLTVGEHRARKAARERNAGLRPIESRISVSSAASDYSSTSTTSGDDAGAVIDILKIVVTRSFGVEPPLPPLPRSRAAGRRNDASHHPRHLHSASAMMAAEIVPFAANDDNDEQSFPEAIDDVLFRSYETECLFSAETNPLLEAIIEEEEREMIRRNSVESSLHTIRSREENTTAHNPFYYPTAPKHRMPHHGPNG